MTKSPFPTKVRNQHGYTLLELMIAAAIGALVFYTLMSLLGQTTNFATHFHGTAGAIEASSDAISQLNGMMPEIVRIRRCSCSGSSTTATASCRWFPPASSAEPNIGKDPVQNYGVASPGTEVEIFAGDFESFGGAVTATGYPGLRGLFTGYLGQGGNASSGIKCAGMDGVLSGLYAKGCKMPISLYYTSPTLESGTTPAKPGSLRIAVGGDGSAFSGGTSDTWIGRPTDTGYRGIVGVTQLSCGFAQSSASSASMLFVLNLKINSRSTTEQNVNCSSYESWWPPLTSSNGGLSG
jgi:prepilin-type N-terminal cleavage/methylation domain-containing protein